MSFAERLESLRTKHATLDSQLKLESQGPAPDCVVLSRLKREKLRLKDEMTRIKRVIH
ncbi:MAG: YdcH family protein [Azospirillaceae bacterium]|nr:YdcH family protein [Azospirillaceae bacterium]